MESILMVTLSSHTSFQDGVFSMYETLKDRYRVYTLTIDESDYPVSRDANNLFVKAPQRPGLSKKAFDFVELIRMINKLRSLDFQRVYFESAHIWNYPIILYCKLKKISIAHAINDVIPHEGDSHRLSNDLLNKFTTLISDRIVLRSNDGLDKAKAKFPKVASKMRKVDIWYSFPEYCSPHERTALFFGRMNQYKGIDTLYELAVRTPNIRYVIAGRIDESVTEHVNKLKTLSNVTVFDGRISYDKMHGFFYNACCVVLPYKTATQSGVIIDAYKHSRPAIAYRVGAIGEEIIDGVTGYAVEPENIDALIECVEKVVNSTDTDMKKMSEEAYLFGVSEYSAASKEKEFLHAIGATD